MTPPAHLTLFTLEPVILMLDKTHLSNYKWPSKSIEICGIRTNKEILFRNIFFFAGICRFNQYEQVLITNYTIYKDTGTIK